MYRLTLFCDNSGESSKSNLEVWSRNFASQFEVTVITNIETLVPLLYSWRPHILIYAEQKFNADRFQSIMKIPNQTGQTAVLVLANSYNLNDEIFTLESGADHYLLLNSPTQLLNARFVNLAKKIQKSRQLEHVFKLPISTTAIELLEYDKLTVEVKKNRVTYDSNPVHLTPTQFRLLVAFLTHLDEPLDRKWLKENVFEGKNISLRSIDAQIAKLKRQIPALQSRLTNLYGKGYILTASRQNAA